jgi:hypothetical protein
LSNALHSPPAPGLRETKPLSTLDFVNAGHKAANRPLLTERDLFASPEQPVKAQKIDPKAAADFIIECGERAGGKRK